MRGVLEYKGYIGTVNMSPADRVFHGILHGINDLVTFEGQSYDELEDAFHEAVEDYLILCEEHGKEPEKAYKGQFNVRISPELHKKVAMKAIRAGVSLNQYVERALEYYVDEDRKAVTYVSEKLDTVIENINISNLGYAASFKDAWIHQRKDFFYDSSQKLRGDCVKKCQS